MALALVAPGLAAVAACFSGRGFAAWLGIDVCMLAGVSRYML